MNLIKLASLTINLDQVAYWTVVSKATWTDISQPPAMGGDVYRFQPDTHEPIVSILLAGREKPLPLGVTASIACLKLISEIGEIRAAHIDSAAPPSGS
jgi:hypothetical protein